MGENKKNKKLKNITNKVAWLKETKKETKKDKSTP